MLTRIGSTVDDLACGPQVPNGGAAARALSEGHGEPVRVHNNCSGKHGNILATVDHLGELGVFSYKATAALGHWLIQNPTNWTGTYIGEARPAHGLRGVAAHLH